MYYRFIVNDTHMDGAVRADNKFQPFFRTTQLLPTRLPTCIFAGDPIEIS